MLEPDRDQIELFVQALFRHAAPQGFVSVRAFYEDEEKPSRISPTSLSGGLGFLIDVAEDDARRAVQTPRPIVFCPPIAVFKDRQHARERDITQGLALSVECDQHPQAARQKLEQILGPATVVVRSGGQWLNGGEPEPKLHLHWRLARPAENDALPKLKQARDIAARLVGGDPTGKSIVHPFRWPGSWHRKAEPILCTIETINPDREIDLDTALSTLTAAQPIKQASEPGNETPPSGLNDWGDLVNGIISGKTYHPAIIPLSAKLVTAGLDKGATVNLIRALMHNSAGPRDNRWQSRFDKIPDAIDSAQEKFGNDQKSIEPLPWIDMSRWDDEPAPGREWAIHDRVPLRQAGLVSGEGGAGKSIIELTKNVAHIIGKDWFGSMPEQGGAFYIGAEDEADEIHRRLEAIAHWYGTTFNALIAGGLRTMSLLGKDATLCATGGKGGKVETTALYRQIYEAAGDLKPKNISIDTLSRAFAGSEIDRVQVYGFASHMQALAMVANGSVTILSHPSLAGISSGTGLSGTTGWHGAFRFRQYLKGVRPEGGEQSDDDLRELEFKKNQYGPRGETIVLRYDRDRHLFLPVPGMNSLDKAAREIKADDVFLDLLRRFRAANRNVGDKPGPNYAPTLFAREDEAKKATIGNQALAEAMRRLFKADKIWNEPYSRAGHEAYRIAAKL